MVIGLGLGLALGLAFGLGLVLGSGLGLGLRVAGRPGACGDESEVAREACEEMEPRALLHVRLGAPG